MNRKGNLRVFGKRAKPGKGRGKLQGTSMVERKCGKFGHAPVVCVFYYGKPPIQRMKMPNTWQVYRSTSGRSALTEK